MYVCFWSSKMILKDKSDDAIPCLIPPSSHPLGPVWTSSFGVKLTEPIFTRPLSVHFPPQPSTTHIHAYTHIPMHVHTHIHHADTPHTCIHTHTPCTHSLACRHGHTHTHVCMHTCVHTRWPPTPNIFAPATLCSFPEPTKELCTIVWIFPRSETRSSPPTFLPFTPACLMRLSSRPSSKLPSPRKPLRALPIGRQAALPVQHGPVITCGPQLVCKQASLLGWINVKMPLWFRQDLGYTQAKSLGAHLGHSPPRAQHFSPSLKSYWFYPQPATSAPYICHANLNLYDLVNKCFLPI